MEKIIGPYRTELANIIKVAFPSFCTGVYS